MNEVMKRQKKDVSKIFYVVYNTIEINSIQLLSYFNLYNFKNKQNHSIERRLDFEKRRKLHYNEFEALKLARKLMEEDEEDDDIGATKSDDPSQQASVSTDNNHEKTNTIVEVDMDNDNS